MLAKKLKFITPSYTLGIASKVKILRESGEKIINLSIGEPDFYTPEIAKDWAKKAMDGNKTKYDSVSGLKELKQAIIEKFENQNDLYYTESEIVVSSGAKHSITNSLIATLDPGDEVMIPKPYWVSYPEMVKLTGGVPVFVDTQKDNNYKVAPKDLEKALTSKSKMLFITNPSNPSGAVYTRDELLAIGTWCVENNIWIMADEIYERITFDRPFVSIASLSESIKKLTITVNGMSKSAAMTGWRIGYTGSTEELAKAMSAIQGHLVSHPATISQWAAYGAMAFCQSETDKMVETYKTRRDIAVKLLEDAKDIFLVKPEGAFYLFIDLSAYKSFFPEAENFSVAFCDKLLTEKKIAIVPGMAFGMDDFVRIAYACDEKELVAGLEGIKDFLSELK
ncbi:MAG: pyridoxal phosphate-dependent aminotransferase [Peptostreptococcaceae bacterium]|nr:pyridoxal phosphate-dependent aminotransferase [Peptostreptococcaceae bacterium]